ncbi:MAG TPA: TonB family protein [Kofleriaceae bacterium]|nr:TonB family protein [Kofleriaceae bacterium]
MLRVVVALCCVCATAWAQPSSQAPAPSPPKPTGVVTKSPKLIQAQAPEYPPAALQAGKAAKVKVRIHIDETGIVTAVDVVEPVGDGFDEAARAAAMQYIFEPAEIDGKPGKITVETTINFVIEKQVEEPPPPPPPPADRNHDGPPNHAGPMASPVALSGTVVERGTRKALAGVIVSIKELGLDVVTGNDGSFFFHGVAPGNYQLLAVDDKYDRFSRAIVLSKREALEVRLWLRPRGGNPYETVLEGEKESFEVTKRTLTRDQLTSVPGTFGDPIRVLQTLPGVARAPFGLGLLIIRGSNPNDSGIFIDGHEVPALFHFLGGPSIFNAQMLESLTLYPGGFPGRFGRFDGGVVALETRPTQTDGVHGEAKVDFLDAGGYVRVPITDDLSVAVAGRRSYIDALLGFVLPKPSDGGERIVTPIYYDYQARIDYNMHDNGRLSLFLFGSSDGLHVLDSDPETDTSEDLNSSTKFFRVLASYTKPLGGDLKLTISPAWGRDTITLSGAEAGADGPFSSLGVVTDNLSYRMRIEGNLAKRIHLDTGIDIVSRVTSYQALLPIDDTGVTSTASVNVPPTDIFRGASLLGGAIYADLGIDLTDRIRLIPTLRLDGYIFDGEYRGNIDPRIVVRYKLDDFWTLKAYVGEFTEPPVPETFDSRFGNPNVGLEHGTQYGLGYEWRPDHRWSVDSEIFYVDRRDLVAFTDAAVMNNDGSYTFVNFDNNGHSYAYGLELLIKREISEHFYAWLSYTYSRALQYSTSTDTWHATAFDEPHVMNAIASWKPGGGWEVGLRYQLASGRPYTPVVGATYDADAGAYVPVHGDTNSVRLPLFSQLDARVEKDWLFNRWSFGVYLDIINVLDQTNVEAVQYDYRYRDSAPITSFPFVPDLGVKGTW